jgi:hypothetical protein
MGYEIGSKRGVANHYGVRGTDNQYGGQDNSVGKVKEASWTFDWDKLPAYTASNLEQVLPANATVLSAHLRVLTAATSAGTPTMTVGLTTTAGVVVDADGLLSASDLTWARIQVKGLRQAGTGALVAVLPVGTAAVELVVATSAALTGGKFELVVKYQYN